MTEVLRNGIDLGPHFHQDGMSRLDRRQGLGLNLIRQSFHASAGLAHREIQGDEDTRLDDDRKRRHHDKRD